MDSPSTPTTPSTPGITGSAMRVRNGDDVAVTPLSNKVVICTPRSSVAGYNLRPAEVLKRRLSAGKLKFACASTPRRKSVKPKGFLSAKKLETDRNTAGWGMEESGDLNPYEMDAESVRKDEVDHVTSEGSCSPGERRSSNLSYNGAMNCDIMNGLQLDLLSPIKRKRVSNAVTADSPEKVNCLGQPESMDVHQFDAVVDRKNLNLTPSQTIEKFSSGNQNNSDQTDAFSTPCLGTPTLNTTFIKDETFEADHQPEIKTEPNIEEEEVTRPEVSSENIKKSRRSSQRKHEKENKSRLYSQHPEPCNVKKVEFSIKDLLLSTSNPDDIRLYAQIQQEFIPLQMSKNKLDLLLSSEDSSFLANKTPVKTPVSKIPKPTPSILRKSILKPSASSICGNRCSSSKLSKIWTAGRPFDLHRSSSTHSLERNYRRHTLSSAAKVKSSHLLPAVSITTVAIPEVSSSRIPKNKTGTHASVTKRIKYQN
ncbi:unnamed protein product [Allacma fusca]|uniref:Uncharacterized protein n=1 Tax=Allacma fusca TaxID=39272 RepID=A0A8J2JJZ5_9HEXA|nr:unnamed protein product [Allacma fusca]